MLEMYYKSRLILPTTPTQAWDLLPRLLGTYSPACGGVVLNPNYDLHLILRSTCS